MDEKMKFDFRDLAPICRRAFSIKKMLTLFFFLFLALAVYCLFAWLGILIGGSDVEGPFFQKANPLILWKNLNIAGMVVHLTGSLMALWLFAMGRAGCSRVVLKELRGDYFFSTLDAIKFAFKNAFKILFSYGLILLLLFMLAAGGLFCALVFMVPYVGELFNSIAVWFVIPFSLVFVFVSLTFIAGLRYIPVLSGIVDEDFFEVVYQLFSSVTAQPGRFIIYTLITNVLSIFGMIVWSVFLFLSVYVYYFVYSLFVPLKTSMLFVQALNWLGSFVPGLSFAGFSALVETGETVGFTMGFSGFVLFCALGAVVLFATAYHEAVKVCGDTMNCIIIRYKKDEEDLTEENEEDELDFEKELKKWEEADKGDGDAQEGISKEEDK